MNQVSFHEVKAAWLEDSRDRAESVDCPAYTSTNLMVVCGDDQVSRIVLYGTTPFKDMTLYGTKPEEKLAALMNFDLHSVAGVRMIARTAVDNSGFRWNAILVEILDYLGKFNAIVEIILFSEQVVAETIVIH